MAETKKQAVDLTSIRKAKGFVNVVFEESLGNNEAGSKAQMHRSTAQALETTGKVKILSDVEVYKPKKIKE
tara:strand:- start:3806 stop:4018 length:213 start_codon:yes stop_codon:yes gene_type:complete